jgi:hypothetical protein
MPRTVPAAITDAIASQAYQPAFVLSAYSPDDTLIFQTRDVVDFQIRQTAFTVKFVSLTRAQIPKDSSRLILSRGIVDQGEDVLIHTSKHYLVSNIWDGKYTTLDCQLFPEKSYLDSTPDTWRTVITEFCAAYGKTPVFADDEGPPWDYQFVQTGQVLSLANSDNFLNLLKQKYFVFAADNGNETVLFYKAFEEGEAAPGVFVTQQRIDFALSENRTYVWVDEDGNEHRGGNIQLISELDLYYSGASTSYYARKFTISPSGLVVLATEGNGYYQLLKSYDNGYTWQYIESIPGFNMVLNKPMYATKYLGNCLIHPAGGTIRVSTNDGGTWTSIASHGTTYQSSCIHKENLYCFAVSTNGINLRVTNGATWWYTTGGQMSFEYIKEADFVLGCSSNDIGLFITTEAPCSIMRSLDDGLTWATVKDLSAVALRCDAVLAIDQNTIIATYNNNDGSYIIRSVDNGDTWSAPISIGFERCWDLSINDNGVVFGSCTNKIIRSSDYGQTWETVETLSIEVRTVIHNPDGSMLFGGGNSGGTAKIYLYPNAAGNIYSLSNLGFLPSDCPPPTASSQNLPPFYSPAHINLSITNGDSLQVQTPYGTFPILCAEITEQLNLSATPPWNIVATETRWLANTQVGSLPPAVAAIGSYLEVNTANFDGILSDKENSLQAALDAIDDHDHGSSSQIWADTQDPTGWLDPAAIVVSYSTTTRKITLTHPSGELVYYWQGTRKTLTSPWVSAEHNSADGNYFLYSTDGITFAWSTTVWKFYMLMVAKATKSTTPTHHYALREPHGLMPWQVHKELHELLSSYRSSGGGLTAATYAENTATDAATTPGFDAAIMFDEDIETAIAAWAQGTYTTLRIGAGAVATFDTASSFPFRSSGSYILINNPTTGAETAGSNNQYVNVYQILVPATADANSQPYRMLMLQPQAQYSSLAAALAEPVAGLNLGDLATTAPEFVFYARITYVLSAGDANTGKCRIATGGVTYISGSRVSQVISAAVPNAENIPFAPTVSIAATNVQAAIVEVEDGISDDTISGLQLLWVSATALTVRTGFAVLPNGVRVKVSSAIAKTSLSLSASTWYHVYLYLNSGTPDIEIVTTAPASPYIGTARAKTGDTSRRYLGSARTDASGNIYPFVMQGLAVKYNVANATSPFRVLLAGSATTNTAASVTNVAPVTARIVTVFAIQNGSASGYVTNANNEIMVIALAGQRFSFDTFTESENLYYRNSGAGGIFHLDILGYIFER